MGLKELFFKSAVVNASTAALNLLGTVLIVRWFGAGVYADYLVDLAYLALLAIVLEIIPSNYAIFRVQDEPERIRGIAAFSLVAAFVLAAIASLAGYLFDLFNAFSVWIVVYAATMSIKRYLDTRLQSTGRLREYFGIELFGAAVRVVLMGLLFLLAVNSVVAVWASLACAALITQICWFSRNTSESQMLLAVADRSAWDHLYQEKRAYLPYYLGIVLKRVRDNLVQILASVFFLNREALGAFFLAYRGLIFTVGQIRIIEGLLNHRHTLNKAVELSTTQKILVAIVCQLVCFIASLGLTIVSGVEDRQYIAIAILSAMTWFYVFSTLERAKAYSNYDTMAVNSAVFAYCIAIVFLVTVFSFFSLRSATWFVVILFISEGLYLYLMKYMSKLRDINI